MHPCSEVQWQCLTMPLIATSSAYSVCYAGCACYLTSWQPPREQRVILRHRLFLLLGPHGTLPLMPGSDSVVM